jgi:hypothetical protein
MRHLGREPGRFLAIWTLLCAIPVVSLATVVMAPEAPGCSDMCGLSAGLAFALGFAVVMVWLAVCGLVLWMSDWRG